MTRLGREADRPAQARPANTTPLTAPQLSPSIMFSGYVYNTAAGTLDTVVPPTPVAKG